MDGFGQTPYQLLKKDIKETGKNQVRKHFFSNINKENKLVKGTILDSDRKIMGCLFGEHLYLLLMDNKSIVIYQGLKSKGTD